MSKATWSSDFRKERMSRFSFSTLFCSVINSKFTADTSELSPKMQRNKNTNHAPWREGGSFLALCAGYGNFPSAENTDSVLSMRATHISTESSSAYCNILDQVRIPTGDSS